MTVSEFSTALNTLLRIQDFSGDPALNGLQVGSGSREVRKAAFAVDACQASFEEAASRGADILVVHHGLFWGSQMPVTGIHYERIRFLVEHNLALHAVHLPLDAHPDLGNNIGLARVLGLVDIEGFGLYRGQKIGIKGRLPRPLRIEEVSNQLFGDERGTLGRLPFGKEFNETVGIISGGATMDVSQAIAEGLDLYITGESGHTVYHTCLEAGINVIFGGHYLTEVWGVSQLARHCAAVMGIETTFIDLPSGF